jgi:hypothetical protein
MVVGAIASPHLERGQVVTDVMKFEDIQRAIEVLDRANRPYRDIAYISARWNLKNDPRIVRLPYADVCAAWEMFRSNEMRTRLWKPTVNPYRWLLDRHGLLVCEWWRLTPEELVAADFLFRRRGEPTTTWEEIARRLGL